MGYIQYDPADGEYHDPSGKSINFISPLPIEECVGMLRHYAFNVWHDGDRLRVEPITPAEYVLESYAGSREYSRYRQKILEGRLIALESGQTWVHAAAIPRNDVVVSFAGMAAIFGLLGFAAGQTLSTTLVLFGAAAVNAVFAFWISQDQQAKSVLADIQRSLDTGES